MRRNRIDPAYCPVWHLLHWLRVSGITYGPMFPAMTKNHKALLEGCWQNASDANIQMKALFKYVGGPGSVLAECSSHSLRKAAASWASRSGKSEQDIKRIGLWSSSSNIFDRYLHEGRAFAEESVTRSIIGFDPVYEFWVCQTSALNITSVGLAMA